MVAQRRESRRVGVRRARHARACELGDERPAHEQRAEERDAGQRADEVFTELQRTNRAAAEEREQRERDSGEHDQRERVGAAAPNEIDEAQRDRRCGGREQRPNVAERPVEPRVHGVRRRDVDDELDCDGARERAALPRACGRLDHVGNATELASHCYDARRPDVFSRWRRRHARTMPVILTQHFSANDRPYEDAEMSLYHYPRVYFSRVAAYDRFVYYRPLGKSERRPDSMRYFGYGVLGVPFDDP